MFGEYTKSQSTTEPATQTVKAIEAVRVETTQEMASKPILNKPAPVKLIKVDTIVAPKPVANHVGVPERGTPAYRLYITFDKNDLDQDGLINKTELTNSMQTWMNREQFSEARKRNQVDYALKRGDDNNDGKLDKSEFIKFAGE